MATLAQPPTTTTTTATMPATTHPYTCNTCQIALRSSDLQRQHMQSDWHRYNLKRRVASLPPLTSETFAEKVLSNQASAAATAARASFEKRCEACEKTYYSEGAFANHLAGKKHRMMRMRLDARGGEETESLAESGSFALGSGVLGSASSTAASESTVMADDEEAEDEFMGVVEGLKKAGLQDRAPSDPVARRPMRPGPDVAAKGHDAAMPDADDDDDDDEDYEHEADLTQCLFCNSTSPSLDLNLTHMSRQHGFFIPEREYLVDLPGLINYLSETIMVLHTCLYCHKAVHTASGVQTHMRDRGHCMIAYSTEEEQMDVGEFYDFRSTYSDEETSEEDDDEAMADNAGGGGGGGGVSLGAKRAVKTTTTDPATGQDVEVGDVEEEDEEGWESDDSSSLSSIPTDEITSIPVEHRDHHYARLGLHRHHSHSDPRPHKNSDGFHSHAHHTPLAVYHDEYELHLPTGRTAGHRSLRTYYRQNLRNYPTPEERQQQQQQQQQRAIEDANRRHDSDDNAEDAAHGQGGRGRRQVAVRSRGEMGMVGVSDAKKREVRAVERKEQRRAQRAENRYRAGNERRANNQKHFRDELLQ